MIPNIIKTESRNLIKLLSVMEKTNEKAYRVRKIIAEIFLIFSLLCLKKTSKEEIIAINESVVTYPAKSKIADLAKAKLNRINKNEKIFSVFEKVFSFF